MNKKPHRAPCILFLVIGIALLLGGCSFCRTEDQRDSSDKSVATHEPIGTELSASSDSPTADAAPQIPRITDLNMEAAKNADGATVFTISADDFIACFNAVYGERHSNNYLTDIAAWTQYKDKTPFFEYDALHYRFSADEELRPMPTLSIFMPENGVGIYELMLTFDDHGYQEAMHQEFKEMCRCVLSAMLPELDDDALTTLYEDLYAQAGINFWGDYYPGSGEDRPGIEAMNCHNSIGLYGYYGAGTVNICIIPLPVDDTEGLTDRGIEIRTIE